MQRVDGAAAWLLLLPVAIVVIVAVLVFYNADDLKYREGMEQSQIHLDIYLESLNKGDLSRVGQQTDELFRIGKTFDRLDPPDYLESKDDVEQYNSFLHAYARSLISIRQTLDNGNLSKPLQLQGIRAVRLEETCQGCHAKFRDPHRP